jgi:hypothetical protein
MHVKLNLSALTCSLIAASAATWSAPTVATQPAGQPAAWRHHDLIVSLHDLPKQYSCDDLWYKFRDLLLALGARQDSTILVYQCGKRAGDLARSPSVHLQFSTPELLAHSQAGWADITAEQQTIRLSPGQPASLRDSDCELMREIKDELLPETAERIVSFDLACPASQPGHWPFSVTVQAVTPINGNPRVAARADALPKRAR